MNDRKAIIIAVLASLMFHTTLFYFGAVLFSRHVWMSADELWAVNVEPIEPSIDIPEPPLPILPPEMDQLGEADGTGTALDTLEFPEPQQSNQIGAEQAALTRAIPTQRRSSETVSSSLGPTRKRQQLRPMGPSKPIEGLGENPPIQSGIDQPADPPDAVDPIRTDGSETEQSQANQNESSSEQPDSMQSNEADSTGPDFNASDQDSDPFSAEQAYEFRAGGTRARGGRDVKMHRPRVDLQFRADVTRLGMPLGILTEITIGEDSKPIDVVIIKSSGSEAIDDAVRLALFSSTFGQPAPAKFKFGVLFY